MKAGLARAKPIQDSLNHTRATHGLGALMTVTMSENKAVSILVALVFHTALVYFRYLPIVLNFFFSLV